MERNSLKALQKFPGKRLPTEENFLLHVKFPLSCECLDSFWISQERYATLWADPPFTAKSDKV